MGLSQFTQNILKLGTSSGASGKKVFKTAHQRSEHGEFAPFPYEIDKNSIFQIFFL